MINNDKESIQHPIYNAYIDGKESISVNALFIRFLITQ